MKTLIMLLPALGTAVGGGLATFYYKRQKLAAPRSRTSEITKLIVSVVLALGFAAWLVIMAVAMAD